jgi:hypothetical protein
MKRAGRRWMAVALVALVATALAVQPGTAEAVTMHLGITVTADNYYNLYIDGTKVLGTTSGNDWTTAETWSGDIDMGVPHSLAVEAWNGTTATGYNPAGFLCQLDAGAGNVFVETGTRYLYTDSTWHFWSGGPQGVPWKNQGIAWNEEGFDFDTWSTATEIAQNKTPAPDPWGQAHAGTVDGISTQAWWIWSPFWDQGPSIDRQDNLVFLGREFTVVPEPVTLAGVFFGIGGVVAYIRKRRAT